MDEAGQHDVTPFLPELLRFGWLIYGDRTKAAAALIRAARTAHAVAGDLRSDEVWKVWLFRELHRESLSPADVVNAAPTVLDQRFDTDAQTATSVVEALGPDGMVEFFQSLPQPRRGAFALHLVNCFTTHELAGVIELQPDHLAAELHQSRLELATWATKRAS